MLFTKYVLYTTDTFSLWCMIIMLLRSYSTDYKHSDWLSNDDAQKKQQFINNKKKVTPSVCNFKYLLGLYISAMDPSPEAEENSRNLMSF